MAWDEDRPEYGEPRRQGNVPISQMETYSLFTLLLVAISGILLIYANGMILFLVWIVITFGGFITNPFLIALWILYLPIGLYQIFLAYGLYKRNYSAGKQTIFLAIVIIAMSILETIMTLMLDQLVLAPIAINVIVLFLLTQTSAKEEFLGPDDQPYSSSDYGSGNY